jgi:hypothetical protein
MGTVVGKPEPELLPPKPMKMSGAPPCSPRGANVSQPTSAQLTLATDTDRASSFRDPFFPATFTLSG